MVSLESKVITHILAQKNSLKSFDSLQKDFSRRVLKIQALSQSKHG